MALDSTQHCGRDSKYSTGPALFLYLDRDEQLLVRVGFCQRFAGARHHVSAVPRIVDLGFVSVAE